MYFKKKTKRILSLMLSAVMVMTAAFTGMEVKADNGTVLGEMVTIDVTGEDVQGRENNFNNDWKFFLGTSSTAYTPGFDDSAWEDVNLPHDFSITQSFTNSGEAESGFLPGGTGWYRKSFKLPAELTGKKMLLNFDGVYSDAYVYVNGTELGEHHYGYTSFAIDITDYVVADGVTENVIAVKAVNNVPTSRWYSGSGIYRDVTLFVMDDVHVDLHGTKVTTPDIASGNGTVVVSVDIVNDGTTEKNVTVTNRIYKKGSKTELAAKSSEVTIAGKGIGTVTANMLVNSPELWSVETPNLYTVVTELSVGATVVDTYETDFGFRWFTFDSSGFHLNGENLKLNGVCMHHDQGALGSAAYYDAMYRQLSIMKEMGVNAIRTAHNPADEDYIKICSELGFVVIEETFDGLVDRKNYNSNDFSKYFETEVDTKLYGAQEDMTCAEFAARAHVKRDRNEPCIIAWSFGNEIQEGTDNYPNIGRYDDICANYISWINDEDGTRPVTSGDNNRGGNSDLVNVIKKITDAGGVAGFNYANSAEQLKSLAQNYGGEKGVIIASETSSAVNSRGQYRHMENAGDSTGTYHLTSYDNSAVSWGITAHDSIYNTYQYDCVAGEFVWTGFDYIGEPTPWNGTGSGDGGRGAIPNSSYFGIVETTGFEKDTYYLYRSQWNKNATTVHLVTAWDTDNQQISGGTTPVWLYSNAPKVELYLNGSKIATSIRSAHTSEAGHTYYTYSSSSDNHSVCTVSNGVNADALYGAYNVVYTAGTLYAKAYDSSGNEIKLDDSCGRHTVSTPGTATKLNATVNKTEMAADGSSLAYVEVDVLDANGNLDTIATNNIAFTLNGPGEIVGVDNGDQATVNKYQQSSVLTSKTSANINAYAGKALVIVRSTQNAGNITINVASSGLEEKTVTIKTTETRDSNTSSIDLVSYKMVKDYTVKVGTAPRLDIAAAGILADGTMIDGTIVWTEVQEDVYGTAGDHTISGILTFAGMDPIAVTARLHVIANVIALRNISTATMVDTAPTLPNTVKGILADGTLAGEFDVIWNLPDRSEYDTVGKIVTVYGTATIFGDETMDVTCSVRVAEAVNTESVNVASIADGLTQNIESGKQSDVLESIRNDILKPGDNTSERWTNWGNRTTNAEATLTFTWATAQMLSGVNIYYYYDNCCAYPENLEFSYSLNGQEYTVIGHVAEKVEDYNLGAHWSYVFDQPINPVGLKIKLTQQSGTSGSHCVGITELQVMTYAAEIEYYSSADLSGITVDSNAIENFTADKLAYEAVGSTVASTTRENAGITVLPEYEGVVRIVTVSEDGTTEKTYEVVLEKETACTHETTELRNQVSAACESTGYTGDTYCLTCGEMITAGEIIKAAGHSWNNGEVTKEATEKETGIKTYTCAVCQGTKEEEIPKIIVKALEPTVSLSVAAASSKLVMTGKLDDYENIDDYYEVTSHGIIYMKSTSLGKRVLTINTSGRTKVNFSSYKADGSYIYRLTPKSSGVSYTIRSYATYINPETGKTVCVYSSPVAVTLKSLSQ